MNFDFLKNESFLEARNYKTSFFFGKLNLPTLTWDEVLEELEKHIVSNLDYDPKNNLRFIIFETTHPTIKEFVKQYSTLDPQLHCGAHGYINLMSKSGENGRHKDQADVLFWQITGKTHWLVEDIDCTKNYILNPGDAVYVPRSVYHTVTSLSPRAGISFGLDYE